MDKEKDTAPQGKKKQIAEEDCGLKLLFQPVYIPSREQVFGYECLLRVVDVNMGMLTPGMFLSVAEKNPTLMFGLEEWALEEIMETAVELDKRGKHVDMLSLNIFTKHFFEPDFYDKVMGFVKATRVKPGNIYLELKEEVLFNREDYVENTLKNLRKSGIKIAIDDFGVDFFTVYRNRKPKMDMVKIDKSYIDNFLTSHKSRSIVEAIIEYCMKNQIDVVAVGVENAEQEKALLELGCDKMQGYYYSKPLQLKRLFRKR